MDKPTKEALHWILDPLTGEGTGTSLVDLDVAIKAAIEKCPTDFDLPDGVYNKSTLWALAFLRGWLWSRERLAPPPGPG